MAQATWLEPDDGRRSLIAAAWFDFGQWFFGLDLASVMTTAPKQTEAVNVATRANVRAVDRRVDSVEQEIDRVSAAWCEKFDALKRTIDDVVKDQVELNRKLEINAKALNEKIDLMAKLVDRKFVDVCGADKSDSPESDSSSRRAGIDPSLTDYPMPKRDSTNLGPEIELPYHAPKWNPDANPSPDVAYDAYTRVGNPVLQVALIRAGVSLGILPVVPKIELPKLAAWQEREAEFQKGVIEKSLRASIG
jgi:hypothetical protein